MGLYSLKQHSRKTKTQSILQTQTIFKLLFLSKLHLL